MTVQRYFFDVTNGHRLADPAGMECRGDGEAIAFADFIAREIAAEESLEKRWVTVRDSENREIGKVPIEPKSREMNGGSQ